MVAEELGEDLVHLGPTPQLGDVDRHLEEAVQAGPRRLQHALKTGEDAPRLSPDTAEGCGGVSGIEGKDAGDVDRAAVDHGLGVVTGGAGSVGRVDGVDHRALSV